MSCLKNPKHLQSAPNLQGISSVYNHFIDEDHIEIQDVDESIVMMKDKTTSRRGTTDPSILRTFNMKTN